MNNEYFHPHQATLKRLEQAQAKIYRTDNMGTVYVVSNGKTISVSTGKESIQPSISPISTPEINGTYIGNKNSLVVHKSTCSNLPTEKNRVYFEDINSALNAGYRKCNVCFKE